MRPLTKPGSDSGSDSGSDRIGPVFSLLVQNYYFREKAALTMTHVDWIFFFRAACVSYEKSCLSCITSLKILLIFSGWLGLSVKEITTYFVWLNIDLFTTKSIITELRQNAAFGAQNLGRISRLRVTK